MKCWVTGAAGLIGGTLMRSPGIPRGWDAVALHRGVLELTDFAAVDRRFELERPGALIHCAAMSRSPRCEAEPARARQWNVDVTRHLAGLFGGRRMIFLSTDLVFDGQSGGYREESAVCPLSVYGETKVEAEQWVLRDPGHLVVRTSLNHGWSVTGDRGFNEEMANAWRAGRTLKLFLDEFRNPIPAEHTARALWELVAKDHGGLLHLAGAQRLSRWEIGSALAATLEGEGFACPIETGSLRDYNGAPRPPDTSLDSSRAQALLGFRIPGYAEWLAAGSPPAFPDSGSRCGGQR
jgi:dTDP-4-dehydrorhamnose reductase